MTNTNDLFPPLPFDEWEATKDTLHLYAQIIGKIRLKLAPRRNHWWHVTLYVTPSGLTTTAMPYNDMTFVIDFDLRQHRLLISTSRGEQKVIDLHDGLSVAAFYRAVFDALAALGITVKIFAEPFDHKSKVPFAEDETNKSYDKDAVTRYWQTLLQIDHVLKTFAARFNGKTSPVHLYWHSFDLAVTRFNGNAAPPMPGADKVTQDAYSHEVISFGWWAGDPVNRFPAFYSYTFPEPAALTEQTLRPDAAFWQTGPTGSMALLKYDDARVMDDPTAAVLTFYESAYQAGCYCAGWDVAQFTYPHAPTGV